jgi:hypothetical protein
VQPDGGRPRGAIGWGHLATAKRVAPCSAPCAGQLLRALACLRHALHDRLGGFTHSEIVRMRNVIPMQT